MVSSPLGTYLQGCQLSVISLTLGNGMGSSSTVTELLLIAADARLIRVRSGYLYDEPEWTRERIRGEHRSAQDPRSPWTTSGGSRQLTSSSDGDLGVGVAPGRRGVEW